MKSSRSGQRVSTEARQAVLDDTLRLWLSYADGWWSWIDMAGYLEERGILTASALQPRLEGDHDQSLVFAPDIRLPVSLLRSNSRAAHQLGIVLLATTRDKRAWFRPLVLYGVTSPRRRPLSITTLATVLQVDPEQIHMAA